MSVRFIFSKKELETDVKKVVEKAAKRALGFVDPAVVAAAISCLDRGLDQSRTKDQMRKLLDQSAERFAEKLFGRLGDFDKSRTSSGKSHRKRKDNDKSSETKAKKIKVDDAVEPSSLVPPPAPPLRESPGQLTVKQIRDMMESAKKQIQERKSLLARNDEGNGGASIPATGGGTSVIPGSTSLTSDGATSYNQPPAPLLGAQTPIFGAQTPLAQVTMGDAIAKARRAAEIQQRIQATMIYKSDIFNKIGSDPYGQTGGEEPEIAMPTGVILDAEGRTVDQSGKAVTFTPYTPTLKANIRAKKREQFRQAFKIESVKLSKEDPTDVQNFLDPRLTPKTAQRPKRSTLKFHEVGKFQKLAQRFRTKTQLDRLQQEISQAAKKTGIHSATRLALVAPKRDVREGEIPDVEWWDAYLLPTESYDDIGNSKANAETKYQGISVLVEHPIQLQPPSANKTEQALPVFLTKKERRKLRRQRRRETEKELQEKIRLGLEPPPEPKVRLANLMRVLGSEAVQDPTKMEAHVRAQMAKRQKTHEEANATRKLTPEQRRDKKLKKIKEDTSLGCHVAVYRVHDLSNPSKKFKIEANCNQLTMTGCVVLFKDINVIVVEGGPKQQRKFQRLMLQRIKWDDDTGKKRRHDYDSDDESERKVNRCVLVWEGTVKNRNFGEMKFKICPTETLCREHFRQFSVEHYWDLAHSESIIEASEG